MVNNPTWWNDYGSKKENLAGLGCGDSSYYHNRDMPTLEQDDFVYNSDTGKYELVMSFCFGSCCQQDCIGGDSCAYWESQIVGDSEYIEPESTRMLVEQARMLEEPVEKLQENPI
jgi:hypothetical protein